MQLTKARILAALTYYPERIPSHNREAFTRFVHIAETAQPNVPKTTESSMAARLRFIHGLLVIMRPELHRNPTERIDTPAGINLKWPELGCNFALDE